MDLVVTKKARLLFPILFTPKKDKQGKEKFSCSLLFENPKDAADIVKACETLGKEAFGKWDDSLKKPYRVEKRDHMLAKYPVLEGKLLVNAYTQFAPSLMDKNKNPIMSKDDLYAGCYVHAAIKPFHWTNKENGKGVSLNLVSILKIEEGEKLGHVAGNEFDTILGNTDLGSDSELEAMFG